MIDILNEFFFILLIYVYTLSFNIHVYSDIIKISNNRKIWINIISCFSFFLQLQILLPILL